ncbi:MAG: hypothetical protein DHS20C14_01420 [Phycisphaeraceae bacterium]|nr:MAG: hypothetical protein DHS20C14_01420 [Phycisphaeraceae bacterium]
MNQNLAQHDGSDPLAAKPAGEGANMFLDLEGKAGGPEPSSGFGGKGGKVGNQAIIAMVLLVLSGGAIYGMRKVGTVSGISGKTLSVEYQPSAINADFERRFDRAMDELARSGRPLQVAAEELPEQPFEIDQRLQLASAAVEVNEADLNEAQRQRREQQLAEDERRRSADMARRITSEVRKLHVQSMIGGRVPVATISGQLCRIGDAVGADGLFNVQDISRDGVIVTAHGRRFLLTMAGETTELFE